MNYLPNRLALRVAPPVTLDLVSCLIIQIWRIWSPFSNDDSEILANCLRWLLQTKKSQPSGPIKRWLLPEVHVRVDTPPCGYSSPRKLRRPNRASSPPIVLMTKRSAPAAASEARTPPYTGGRKQHYRVPTDDNHCAESGDPYNSVSAYGISLRLPPLLKNLGKPRVSRPTTEAHDLRCPLPYSDISSLRIVANM